MRQKGINYDTYHGVACMLITDENMNKMIEWLNENEVVSQHDTIRKAMQISKINIYAKRED